MGALRDFLRQFWTDYIVPYLPQAANDLTFAAWIVLGLILLVSVIATWISVFKYFQFWALGVGGRRKAEEIIRLWLAGNGAGALRLAARRNSTRVRVLHAALSALKAFPNDKDYSRELAMQTAMVENAAMAKGMRGLDAMVQAAPLLGFLGTVLGMIEAFGRLSATGGAADPAMLAAGIWTALLTTAAGLVVAVFFYIISVWFDGRIARERQALDYLMSSFLHGRVDPTAGKAKG